MRLELLPEVAQRREHGVGRRLPEAAEARPGHAVGELLEVREVLLASPALAQPVEDLERDVHTRGS